jgi:hypothetical protein
MERSRDRGRRAPDGSTERASTAGPVLLNCRPFGGRVVVATPLVNVAPIARDFPDRGGTAESTSAPKVVRCPPGLRKD